MLHNLQQAVAAVKRNLVLIFQEKLLFSAGDGLFFKYAIHANIAKGSMCTLPQKA